MQLSVGGTKTLLMSVVDELLPLQLVVYDDYHMLDDCKCNFYNYIYNCNNGNNND